MHVLFVCTGNICRSPIAERLAVAHSQHFGLRGFTAASAGVRAVISHPMHEQAALVLEGLGGDPNEFSARQLTRKIASEADLILTMTREHREAVLETAPRMLRKTFTLVEAARLVTEHGATDVPALYENWPRLQPVEVWDVPDPIGRSLETFERVGAQIAEALLPVTTLFRRASD